MERYKNYIVASGGIGNQMFQYAFYLCQRQKNRNVCFDISMYCHNDFHQGFELNRAFGIDDYVECSKNQSFINRLLFKIASKLNVKQLFHIKIERLGKYITDIHWKKSIIYGYWQGEQFFVESVKRVKQAFNFKDISPRNKTIALKMTAEESVSIHIRRGDFLTASKYINLTKTKYYLNALNFLKTKYNLKFTFYIFSDDIGWCKESGLFEKNSEYVDWNSGDRSYEDMYLMSKCKFNILANSTFSWWAGYLGQHEAVLRPSKVKTDWNKEKNDTYFPRNWIEVSIDE